MLYNIGGGWFVRLLFVFFLMIRRPPRSTPLSLHDALPISRGPSRRPPRRDRCAARAGRRRPCRSEKHTSELQSHFFISYAVFCLKKIKTWATWHRQRRSSRHAHPPLPGGRAVRP